MSIWRESPHYAIIQCDNERCNRMMFMPAVMPGLQDVAVHCVKCKAVIDAVLPAAEDGLIYYPTMAEDMARNGRGGGVRP